MEEVKSELASIKIQVEQNVYKKEGPSNQTPIRNFLLAGSWTDTGASTEMESAIASGDMCAQTMINQLYKHH